MPLHLLLTVAARAAGPAIAAPIDPPPHQWVRQQSFVAPSGEPFHAPVNAPFPSAAWFARADAASQRFEFLDTTHRGHLTLDRLPRTFAQQHKPHRRREWQGQDIPDAHPDR